VTVEQRRAAVGRARAAAHLSERRACRFLGVARASMRYRGRRADGELRARLTELARQRPRWGSRRLHILLQRDGVAVNWKRVYRLYRQAGLSVRPRRRKRVAVARQPLPVPSGPNQRWSLDFVHDALADGRRFRTLTIVDDYTRECPALEVDRGLSGERIVRVLEQLALTRGLPQRLVLDNGPEFAGRALDTWAHARGIELAFIEPGKPVQNAYVESFNGKLRDECLNGSWFHTLPEAQRVIEQWRQDYNDRRPHSSLANRTPSAFANELRTISSPQSTGLT
jgi:putative transposase